MQLKIIAQWALVVLVPYVPVVQFFMKFPAALNDMRVLLLLVIAIALQATGLYLLKITKKVFLSWVFYLILCEPLLLANMWLGLPSIIQCANPR